MEATLEVVIVVEVIEVVILIIEVIVVVVEVVIVEVVIVEVIIFEFVVVEVVLFIVVVFEIVVEVFVFIVDEHWCGAALCYLHGARSKFVQKPSIECRFQEWWIRRRRCE